MAWLSGWGYRKSVTLSRASGAVTNYQMKLLVGESSGATGEDVDCGGKCLASFNDLRFTSTDGTTLLDYWIESISGATPNQLATIWIEFDSIGTSSTTFFMYYGKLDASAASSGANTFIFFDDFERGVDEDAIGGDWTDVGGTAKIDTAQAWNGTRSGRLYNTSGIWKTLTPSENISIAVRARKGDAEGCTFRFEWSSTKRVPVKWEAGDEYVYYIPAATWISLGVSASHSSWHKFEFNNFNGTAFTYDVWLDDTQIGNDLAMQDATELSAGQLWLYGRTAGEYSWYDTVYVRNWRATGPAWGTWSAEEAYSIISGVALSAAPALSGMPTIGIASVDFGTQAELAAPQAAVGHFFDGADLQAEPGISAGAQIQLTGASLETLSGIVTPGLVISLENRHNGGAGPAGCDGRFAVQRLRLSSDL